MSLIDEARARTAATDAAGTDTPWRWEHYKLFGPILRVEVRGLPVPQGSIRSLGKGRPSIHSNAARLKPWREQVQGALEDAIRGERLHGHTFPIDGAVAIDATFTMRKSKSAPKRRRTFPTARPDADKLLRALLDAGTAAGVWRDDAQVVQPHTRKVFPLEHPQALEVPGLYMFLYTVAG